MRSASVVRRAGASAGAKCSRGSGSKVRMALRQRRAMALRLRCATIAWWPRCTPSKLPMAMALSLAPGRGWRTTFIGSLVAGEVARAEAHHAQRGEVGERGGDDHQRELGRARARGDLEPRGLASHGVPDGAAHEIEGDRELDQERGPPGFRAPDARA